MSSENKIRTSILFSIANEYVTPAYAQDGTPCVGFFKDGKQQFCIPVKDDKEAISLAYRMQELFVSAIERYAACAP